MKKLKMVNTLICINLLHFMVFNSWRTGFDLRGMLNSKCLLTVNIIYHLLLFSPVIIILGTIKIIRSKWKWLDITIGLLLILTGVILIKFGLPEEL